MGLATKPPPQLGHVLLSLLSTHDLQNVHSKLQINASDESGGRSLSQHSQLGRSSSIIQSYTIKMHSTEKEKDPQSTVRLEHESGMVHPMTHLFKILAVLLFTTTLHASDEPLRLAVIGLDHGHVEGVLWNATSRGDLQIVGIYDPSYALFLKFSDKYSLDPDLFYANLNQMLDETDPEAASVMTPIARHLEVVEACAPRGIHTLLEKPLSYDYDQALQMAQLGEKHNVHVLTNFETSWYSSVREAARLIEAGESGKPTRYVFRHGHPGPVEIGCALEFVRWLADPAHNGGGAIVDFGCYGANIMTWIMGNQRPTAVHATTQQLKPELYPLVDDDATIVLTYPHATAVIQASWAWTHDNKEMDIHATGMSIHAAKWDALEIRSPDGERKAIEPAVKQDHLRNEWSYLRALVRGECKVDPLSSIENNVIVAQILDAAIESAKTGKTINLIE
jgi:predicted dehydrogenase